MAIHAGRKQTTITPFWNRMPRFFLYPLTPPGLYVLFALAVINAVSLDLLAAGGGGLIVASIVGLVAALFAIKYGYDILERTAHGNLQPPRLNRETLLEGYELPFKQYAVIFLLVFMGIMLAIAFAPVAILFAIAVFLLFPAIVMTLAIERSVFAALNPRMLCGIAFRVGWPYLAVLGLALLLSGGAATAMAMFGDGLPLPARAFLGAFTQNLFWFSMMHLMGYLLYQYHDRLGFSPEALAEADDGWGDLLAPVQEDIEVGAYVAAANRLQALINQYPEHALDLRLRRHQVLRLGDDHNALFDNAGYLLASLIDANRLREATEVYLDITRIDPDIRPGREEDFEPLMRMLVQRGEYRRAVRMVNGFHKLFPASEAVPSLYLEVARVFSDHLGQPAKARQVADFLARKFPDHPAANRARALRDAVTG